MGINPVVSISYNSLFIQHRFGVMQENDTTVLIKANPAKSKKADVF